jgi:hypothetical protein
MGPIFGVRRATKACVTMVLSAFIFVAGHPVNSAGKDITQREKEVLERQIPAVAERCIGIPYRFGNDFRMSGALDNSHLFFLIYDEAARQAGLRFRGYMPMEDLLKNAWEVNLAELRNGDLIVLNDGLAAMVYRVGEQDGFQMIYASEKRQEVISFSSRNLVYEVYWQENLRGFYRLAESMFSRLD